MVNHLGKRRQMRNDVKTSFGADHRPEEQRGRSEEQANHGSARTSNPAAKLLEARHQDESHCRTEDGEAMSTKREPTRQLTRRIGSTYGKPHSRVQCVFCKKNHFSDACGVVSESKEFLDLQQICRIELQTDEHQCSQKLAVAFSKVS